MSSESSWDDGRRPAPWEQDEDAVQHWDVELRRARAAVDGGLLLGQNVQTKLPVYIHPSQLRTHMHVLGATNVGKSYYLEGIIKSLILGGHGVAVIDPHGDL